LQECSSVPTPAPHMTWLYFAVPLMIVAVAIAVVPVLVGSFRHSNEPEIHFRSVAQEADFWHHMLGHRTVEELAPTPDLVRNRDILRVVPDDRILTTESTPMGSRAMGVRRDRSQVLA